MTVGYQNVGKTTLLDCIFPLRGMLLFKPYKKKNELSYFVLKGSTLQRFKDRKNLSEEALETFNLASHCKVEEDKDKENEGYHGISITINERKQQRFSLFSSSKEEKEAWIARLKRAIKNESTHGIAISSPEPNLSLVSSVFGEEKDIQLTVWDFAGQQDYYNNHHYFLSLRTVFLVLFPLNNGDAGFEGLSFWLRSLSSYLDISHQDTFSIIVVGTFLDDPKVDPELKKKRANKAQNIAIENGLEIGIIYQEVSCLTLENVEPLEDAIYRSLSSHSYMGEKIPETYLTVECVTKELRKEKSSFPVVELEEIVDRCQKYFPVELETVRRAISLLSLWGECCYFEEEGELSKLVILDPKFLSQGILADLFRHDPAMIQKRRDGIIHHSDLRFIWLQFRSQDLSSLAPVFLRLLEKFGVLFPMEEDKNKQFEQRRVIVPSLLPERSLTKEESFKIVWPQDPPFNRPVEVERILKFNTMPLELVSRLLVQVHPWIQDGLVSKNEVILLNRQENTQIWVRAEPSLNRLIIILRGTNLSSCIKLLSWIVEQVRGVAKKHKALKWSEQSRSPHYYGSEIDLETIEEDQKRPKEERRLVCPVTGFPLNPDKLLQKAGKMEYTPPSKGASYFSPIFFLFFLFLFSCS